jgi:hypothetical protein
VFIRLYCVGRGGRHEKTRQNQPAEGGLEEERGQKTLEKVQRRKKVWLLIEY